MKHFELFCSQVDCFEFTLLSVCASMLAASSLEIKSEEIYWYIKQALTYNKPQPLRDFDNGYLLKQKHCVNKNTIRR